MFNVSKNGIITITRGDSFALDVFVNLGTELEPIPYLMGPGDILCFALMEPNQPFEHALIRLVFTEDDETEEGVVSMQFPGEMTEFIVPGNYYYEIKLVRPQEGSYDLIDTIVSKTKITIID